MTQIDIDELGRSELWKINDAKNYIQVLRDKLCAFHILPKYYGYFFVGTGKLYQGNGKDMIPQIVHIPKAITSNGVFW